MALTLSGTNGVVGAGFTVDNSGVSVTAGVGTFSSLQGSGANLTSLPAANLTGTLPALSAASLTSIPAANIVGVCTSGLTKTGGFGGITHADQWRVTSDFTMNSAYAANITANWERNDTQFEKIGDGMSVDGNGHWTFPTTGKWLIQVHWIGERSSGNNYWGIHYCYGMTDGVQGNAFEIMQSYSANYGNNSRQSAFMQVIFDVQDTSGYKLLFGYYDNNVQTTVYRGSSASCENAYTFIRLGDT